MTRCLILQGLISIEGICSAGLRRFYSVRNDFVMMEFVAMDDGGATETGKKTA